MSDQIDTIIDERADRYGKFIELSQLSQLLKQSVRRHAQQVGTVLQPDQLESIEMICHKVARIANGDPNYIDSWLDIAGYSKLVADRLNGNAR